jgi:hypothetical protein
MVTERRTKRRGPDSDPRNDAIGTRIDASHRAVARIHHPDRPGPDSHLPAGITNLDDRNP